MSIGGGYHSITVTLDNRDVSNPVIIASDQNPLLFGSDGWCSFDNKADFDTFMTGWSQRAGDHDTRPERVPRLERPTVDNTDARPRPGQ